MKKFNKIVAVGAMVLTLGATSMTAFAANYNSSCNAVAGVTGRTVESIIAERAETGKSCGTIAEEAGKLGEFKVEVLDVKNRILNSMVECGVITQDKADQIINAIKDNQALCDGTQKNNEDCPVVEDETAPVAKDDVVVEDETAPVVTDDIVAEDETTPVVDDAVVADDEAEDNDDISLVAGDKNLEDDEDEQEQEDLPCVNSENCPAEVCDENGLLCQENENCPTQACDQDGQQCTNNANSPAGTNNRNCPTGTNNSNFLNNIGLFGNGTNGGFNIMNGFCLSNNAR